MRLSGAAQRVHRSVGSGFLESVYEYALLIELRELGLSAEHQVPRFNTEARLWASSEAVF